ncbi:GntR family transcriptional regulator [Lactiplantibacillus modestisalitolerans]|uniref:GntR family transcriptional regulator n=1 Tax=Lactiplantibacillus modestisalitolerans TaxID=1457219 RepID=A0ABV5WXC1_9LACO|nr:GntR family transcriptional regulator [Lactiplantibacillus modestisalitolerans]
MQFDDKVPIYYQIKQYVYQQIITGKWQPGTQLPAVRQLAVELTVNVNTVQRALRELIAAQILISKRGKGNFVTTDQTTLATLADQLVQDRLGAVYDDLRALNLTDQQIITAMQTYIEKRGRQDEHDFND